MYDFFAIANKQQSAPSKKFFVGIFRNLALLAIINYFLKGKYLKSFQQQCRKCNITNYFNLWVVCIGCSTVTTAASRQTSPMILYLTIAPGNGIV